MGFKYEMEQRLNLTNAFGGTFVFFSNAKTNAKKCKRTTKPTHQDSTKWTNNNTTEKKGEVLTVTVAQLPFLEILFPKHKILTSFNHF